MTRKDHSKKRNVNIGSTGDVNIGGDVIGRDKITTIVTSEDLREKHYRVTLNWDKSSEKPRLRGYDLSNRDLRAVNLSGADLIGTNLQGANLRDAVLSGADLREVNLTNANLINADFQKANLENAKVNEAQLRATRSLRLAYLANSSLYDGRYHLAGDWNAFMQHSKRYELAVQLPLIGKKLIPVDVSMHLLWLTTNGQSLYEVNPFSRFIYSELKTEFIAWLGISYAMFKSGDDWARNNQVNRPIFLDFEPMALDSEIHNFVEKLVRLLINK